MRSNGVKLLYVAIGAVILLLLIPASATANTVGFSSGDTLVFSFERYTTYATPNGNQTYISMNQFTVYIDSVNATAKGGGVVGYSETIQEYNNTAITNSTAYANFTTIFNPYDNSSYLGNIGFWPFAYTDIPSGNITNLGVNVTATNVPYGNGTGTVSSIQRVNATIARTPGLIDVNMTTIGSAGEHPSRWIMQYNSTTGVLEYSKTTVNLISIIEGIYTYNLLSDTPPSAAAPAYQRYIPYVIVGVIVAVVVAAALSGRRTQRQKSVAKIRQRLSQSASSGRF